MNSTPTGFPNVPRTRGRILIGGQILTSGFATREVKGIDGSLLGEVPNVDVAKLVEAVEAASKARAWGLGDWPTARMGDRIKAMVAFRDRMIETRDLVCRFLMWEIGKSWSDSQSEFDRTIC